MNLQGIEIPNEIIDAINEERLVIFAGAGVSMGYPTNLPSFKELTKFFSKKNYFNNIETIENKNNDQYLGKLENQNIYVHNIISKIFEDKNLKPNEYHNSLIDLFGKSKKIRIVTTNYDQMFEKVLEKKGIKTNIYSNPALPYGDDFEGVIHLHGIASESKNLVATDKDFGKVYMYYSNVTKFLSDLFNSNYVILFIGYSYNDLIMRYFTKAIPNIKTKRFIFVDDITIEDVKSMGLIPIRYEINDFKNLYQSIKRLSEFVNRDAFSWDNRILQISNTNPSFLDIQTEGELRHILSNIHLIHKFLNNIDSLGWLIYFNYKGYLKNLFNEGEFNDFDYEFVKWILKNFMNKNFEEFKYLLVKNNFVINVKFQNLIIENLDNLNEEKIEQILSFINLEKLDSNILIKISKVLQKTEIDYYKAKLLKFILKFRYEYRKLNNFLEKNEENKQIEINASISIDRENAKNIYKDIGLLKKMNYVDLSYFLSSQIINLYKKNKLGFVNQNFINYDLLTKKKINTDIDLYILILLDTIEKICDKKYLNKFVDTFISSQYGILRRLAKYLYIKYSDIVEIDRVINNKDLEIEKYEIVRLIRIFYKKVDNVKEFEIIFNKLKNENQIRIIYKDEIFNNLDEGIDYILKVNDERKESILKDLSELSKKDFVFAKSLMLKLVEKGINNQDIWGYTLKGLTQNKFSTKYLTEIFEIVDSNDLLKENTYYLALFLKRIVEKNSIEIYEKNISQILDFIEKLQKYSKDYTNQNKYAWSDLIYNSSNGVVSNILIKLIQKIHEKNEILNSKKLSKRIFEILKNELLNKESLDTKFVIVGNLSLLYNINKKWVVNNLLKFLNIEDTDIFSISWKGFLTFSRMYPEISILLDEYFKLAIYRIDEIEKEGKFREDFIKTYTLKFIINDYNKNETYILALYRLKDRDIEIFYNVIYEYIIDNSDISNRKLWDTWLYEFIKNRIENIPIILKKIEIEEIIKIILTLDFDDTELISKLPMYNNLKFEFTKEIKNLNLETNKNIIIVATYISNSLINQKLKQPKDYLIKFLENVKNAKKDEIINSDLEYNLNILGIK